MKYLLLMFNDEAAWERLAKSEQDTAVEGLVGFGRELADQNKLIASHGLAPSSEAFSIRRRDAPSVTDGPYAETKEVVGGYYLIECGSRAEALEWAKRLPLVTWGVEVRRVQG
jgi:hypothetical protein